MAQQPLKNQLASYLRNLGKNLVKSGFILEGEIKKTVAIDTKALHNDIRTGSLQVNGPILKISVGSENIEYAKYVENGTRGRIAEYHRREGNSRPVVWVGVGMQYMERSVDSVGQQIVNTLQSTKR